jgi:hypothetical protein
MNHALMNVAAWSLVFLDLTEEDQLDLDLAVEQMEQIAAMLNEFSPEERSVFTAHVEKLAQQEKRKEVAESLRSIPEALGWVESGDGEEDEDE